MKGVSAIIAVVLILMITVALAAMSYVWFTNVFQTLSESGTSSIAKTTGQLQASFTIESARYLSGNNTSVSLRNTGVTSLDLSKVAFYLKGIPAPVTTGPTGTLTEGQFTTTAFVLSNVTTGAICPGPTTLTATIAQGYSQSVTVSCS
jgi:flagellin-like protein